MPDARSCARVVVFDIGGVLLDWDPRYLYRTLFDNDAEMEEFLAEVCTPAWNIEQDRGRPFAEAVSLLIERFPDQADRIRAYDERWEEMIPRAFDDVVALLHRLQAAGRPTYALTNFSAEKFPIAKANWPFLDSFAGVVVSGEEGVIKPDPAIFRILLDRFALNASECLFIDDKADNAEAARDVGLHATTFTDAKALEAVLGQHGLLTVN